MMTVTAVTAMAVVEPTHGGDGVNNGRPPTSEARAKDRVDSRQTQRGRLHGAKGKEKQKQRNYNGELGE